MKHEEIYRGELFKKFSQIKILICGAGTLGSNLTEALVRNGFKQLTILDKDRVEEHNLGNQCYGYPDLGAMKVSALSNRLYRDLKVTVKTIDKELNQSNVKKFTKDTDLIVDCFDNFESRSILKTHGINNQLSVIHLGLYENYGEIIWNEKYTVPKNNEADICDYPLARNISLLTVIVGVEEIIRYIQTGKRQNYAITLKDMRISHF